MVRDQLHRCGRIRHVSDLGGEGVTQVCLELGEQLLVSSYTHDKGAALDERDGDGPSKTPACTGDDCSCPCELANSHDSYLLLLLATAT